MARPAPEVYGDRRTPVGVLPAAGIGSCRLSRAPGRLGGRMERSLGRPRSSSCRGLGRSLALRRDRMRRNLGISDIERFQPAPAR